MCAEGKSLKPDRSIREFAVSIFEVTGRGRSMRVGETGLPL